MAKCKICNVELELDDALDAYNAAMVMAADFDRNGVINANDAASISNASLGLSEIDQVEGKVNDL